MVKCWEASQLLSGVVKLQHQMLYPRERFCVSVRMAIF